MADTVHWKTFERFLLHVGCVFVGERGDHRKYHREGLPRPIIVPRRKDLPKFIVQNNLRLLGLKSSDFKDYLRRSNA